MAWRLVEDVTERFGDYTQEWDALNARSANHVLLDSRFIKLSLKYFAESPIHLAVHTGGNHGMVLLRRAGAVLWETFQPAQAPLGFFLFENKLDAGDRIVASLLPSLPGTALELSILHQDPDFSAAADLRGQANTETVPYIETPRLRIEGDYDDYWKQRSKNLKHNLSRQRRRLEEKGTRIELQEVRASGEITQAVREYGRLESAGWKASGGTAVSPDNEQGRFYQELLEAFASTGEAIVYHLLMDGAIVATDLCVVRDGMLVILKTTYDEAIEGFSLAMLLHEEIARQLFRTKKATAIEYYGPVKDWHLRWTEETRTMFHLNCHRHVAVRWAKHAVKRFRQMLVKRQ